MKARQKRLVFLLAGMVGLGLVTWLVLDVVQNYMSYFFYPTEVVQNKAPKDRAFDLGGLVKKGSVERGEELTVRFVVTDNVHEVKVVYDKILPDLFAEGQAVVAHGRLGPDGVFVADQVLAKHDETYMPQEVAEALEQARVEAESGAPEAEAEPEAQK
jgi:cytochrome c-type biogenesis protein CcmE